MKFIEEAENCESIVVTIQKEVAERICAKPKTSDYGAITASINAVADSEIIEYIPREKFLPVPNVDSSVVKIKLNKNKYDIYDIKKYRALIKSAFSMRRKTLLNNLLKNYNLQKTDIENILSKLNFSLSVRGEELDSLDYINLLNELRNFNV
jgi:16S rRNA (adenine1518-N6/adenine1519-N6)-dimethyltransferase